MSRYDLLDIYQAGLAQVEGRICTAEALCDLAVSESVSLVGIGKSAAAMTHGAFDEWGERIQRGLVITRDGYGDEQLSQHNGILQIESAHPVPDQSSLDAGASLLEFLQETPPETVLLFLISGGASSLVEVPRPDIDLQDLKKANRWLLGSGLDIVAVNAVRQSLSQIKGGGLRKAVGDRRVIALYISDVPNDDPQLIGSGLLAFPEVTVASKLPDWLAEWTSATEGRPLEDDARVQNIVIADIDDAIRGCERKARSLGYEVTKHEQRLSGDAARCSAAILEALDSGPPGIHLWGGEMTVVLPMQHGRGGRCQHLALACALQLDPGTGHLLLCAATDGCDGPGVTTPGGTEEDAGALVDSGTLRRGRDAGLDPAACLERADAGSFLAASGDLISTGPTGTNVTDLVIGLSGGEE
ncbi:MAG: glycerate kinase type-2 family protein [Gammaproteobacteria bacterium]